MRAGETRQQRAERINRAFDGPMMVVALLVIPVVVIEASTSLTGTWNTAAAILDWAIWLAFLGEAVVILVVMPDRSHLTRGVSFR